MDLSGEQITLQTLIKEFKDEDNKDATKKQTTEELTLDIVKGITGIAAEFITQISTQALCYSK